MKLVIADVEDASLAQAETELKAAGGTVLAVKTDVSQRSDVERLAERAFDAFGQVHLLFNNAGVAAGGPPWEATWNDWEWVIGVNLWGVIHGVKVFTPRMLAQNTECHIVNTSSAAGLVVGGGSTPYAVTKHAVVALSEGMYSTLQLRNSLVKVSVLCPGMVKTNIVNAERNRPAELRDEPVPMSPEMQAGQAAFKAIMEAATPPSQVADAVFDAHPKGAVLHSQPPRVDRGGQASDRQLAAHGESPKPAAGDHETHPAREPEAGPHSGGRPASARLRKFTFEAPRARNHEAAAQIASTSRASSSHSAPGSASRMSRCR